MRDRLVNTLSQIEYSFAIRATLTHSSYFICSILTAAVTAHHCHLGSHTFGCLFFIRICFFFYLYRFSCCIKSSKYFVNAERWKKVNCSKYIINRVHVSMSRESKQFTHLYMLYTNNFHDIQMHIWQIVLCLMVFVPHHL